jgi:large subunit ribosomal protein L6
MSRIGRKTIPLPKGVSVTVSPGDVRVKGPKGELSHFIVEHVEVGIQDNAIQVARTSDEKQARANHGLMRAVLRNMVAGVDQGFSRQLEILGVGFRAEVKGPHLVLNLGYSHPIEYKIPDGIKVAVDGKTNRITVSGIDRQRVGQSASDIRGFRSPDSYKGKGIRYVGEYVRLKAGKSGKK